jgi:hypothetical protein
MDPSFSSSRNGSPTCSVGGIYVHSRYDPEREALRFAEKEIGAASPSHVVLLGPCLHYLALAVRSILPGARIVALQYSAFFADTAGKEADAVWHPGMPRGLEAFLDSSLDEDAIAGVAVLEWEPASRAFPSEAQAARGAVRDSLDRLASSAATVKSAGRRWIANACASFLLVERAWAPERSTLPVLVVAAGPSLEASLAGLSPWKGSFLTVAVSSALAACRYAGLEPDLVVSTDGGYWSRLHLFPLAARALPLASPLTALPSAAIYRDSGLLLLDQRTFAESQLLPELCPALPIAPHGTVSGTAIRLAARLSEGALIVAGLDLASRGDLDHARPHGFDAVAAKSVSRTAPLEASIWERNLASIPLPQTPWKSSRSLAAYAGALSLDSSPLAGRLFRLGASPVPLRGFCEIGLEKLGGLLSRSAAPPILRLRDLPLPKPRSREPILARKLASWRELAGRATEELGKGSLPSSQLVAELLRSIDIVDYAAARRAVLSGGDPRSGARDLAIRCDDFLSNLQRRFAP